MGQKTKKSVFEDLINDDCLLITDQAIDKIIKRQQKQVEKSRQKSLF